MRRVKKSKVPEYQIALGIVVIVLLFAATLPSERSEMSMNQAMSEMEIKFASLSSANTNYCAGPKIVGQVESDRLQGSCCSEMVFHRYEEQVEGLKAYAAYAEIPPDPYDVPKEWAERMIAYDSTTVLTPEQQAVYDAAVEMSHEKGPCCCKCWRWYAYGGLAKYLIIDYEFTAEQVADVWNLSDGCGGEGHAHENAEGMHS